jgi:hypothetical protein
MRIQKLLNRVEKIVKESKNTDGYFCGQPDIKVSDFSSIYFIKQR